MYQEYEQGVLERKRYPTQENVSMLKSLAERGVKVSVPRYVPLEERVAGLEYRMGLAGAVETAEITRVETQMKERTVALSKLGVSAAEQLAKLSGRVGALEEKREAKIQFPDILGGLGNILKQPSTLLLAGVALIIGVGALMVMKR